MKIVFSRKGFDSTAGGGPSPIVDGRPISLPIPAGAASQTTYGELGFGDHAAKASRGKLSGEDLCHHDPMFRSDGTCLFGQVGAAQTHLANQRVGVGDVFLFFGLFRDEDTGEPHHRMFGWMRVDRMVHLADCQPDDRAMFTKARHPHALAMHGSNDCIYMGEGGQARSASAALRLTIAQGPPSLWNRPSWLKRGNLTYHDRADRWLRGSRLRSVARGQEFVADVGRRTAPRDWLNGIIAQMDR